MLVLLPPQAVPSLKSGGLEQAPFWHISLPLQALPSEQPLVLFACKHPCCALQLSLVHWLPSSQLMGVPERPLLQGVN